jgi:hypothetical protein
MFSLAKFIIKASYMAWGQVTSTSPTIPDLFEYITNSAPAQNSNNPLSMPITYILDHHWKI